MTSVRFPPAHRMGPVRGSLEAPALPETPPAPGTLSVPQLVATELDQAAAKLEGQAKELRALAEKLRDPRPLGRNGERL